MKIAHISDNHLGYSQYRLPERKMDFFLAFEKAVDRIIEEKVDVVIHTGDLFESYQPDMVTLSQCIGVLQKAKNAGIEFVAITGNHDRVLRRGTIPPHKVLEELGLVRLIDPYGTLQMDGLFIAGFRYFPKRIIQQLKDSFFENVSEEAEKNRYSIFMFHQGIGQYLPYEESFEIELSDLPKNFDYYAGGHIHAFVKENLYDGIFSYAGSTEFRTKREVDSGKRGFNIIETERGIFERVELENLRPFEVLKASEDDVEEKLRKLVQKVETCKLPPVVLIDYTYKLREIDTFRKILEKIDKNSLYLKVNKRKITEESTEITDGDGKRISEFLTEFLKEQNQGKKVINLAEEVIDSQTGQIESILKEFVRTELGENWKEVERYLQ